MKSNRQRALELLCEMTVEEKISQLVAAWLVISDDGTFITKEIAFTNKRPEHDREIVLGTGIGQLTRPYGTRPQNPRLVAKGINEIQRYLVGRTRLGIPAMLHEECLTGAMITGATSFPSSLNQGSTWDVDLMERVARVIGKELSSLGIHQGLSPVLDVARDARWGRTEETFSEDPYLTGSLGISYVRGLQGEHKSPIATLKHFLGHSFSEGARNHAPVHIGIRELLNVFGLPFEMVIRGAQPGSVMPAYHDIDGEPCSSSKKFMTDLLKKKWGFDGLVVADYEAPSQLFIDHHVASDMAEASALAVRAGMDVELPSSTCFKEGLKEALDKGYIGIEEIDQAVVRVLTEKFRQGIFDHPFIEIDAIQLHAPDHHALAVEAARKSLVLLKNIGELPLKTSVNVALVGPLADHDQAMYNGYSPPIHLRGVSGDMNTTPIGSLTIRKAIEQRVGKKRVTYSEGCVLFEHAFDKAIFFPGDVRDNGSTVQGVSTDTNKISEAIQAAHKADVVIAVVGDIAGLFQQGTVGEGSDTTSLKLPGVQQEMLDALLDTGKPVVVILVSGRPYTLGRADDEAAAILAAWLPGEGGGEAIAQILYGDVSPSGRTPLSFPRSAGAMPFAYNHVKKAAGMPRQREFGARYPFGYGLSYTQFKYSDIAHEVDTVPVDGVIRVSVTVTNTGKIVGDEVVQLYVRDHFASIVRPTLELKGFARVSLEPKESVRIHFTVPMDVLSFMVDMDTRVVEPGMYSISIGRSAEDLVWTQEIQAIGEVRTLDSDWQFQTAVHIESL